MQGEHSKGAGLRLRPCCARPPVRCARELCSGWLAAAARSALRPHGLTNMEQTHASAQYGRRGQVERFARQPPNPTAARELPAALTSDLVEHGGGVGQFVLVARGGVQIAQHLRCEECKDDLGCLVKGLVRSKVNVAACLDCPWRSKAPAWEDSTNVGWKLYGFGSGQLVLVINQQHGS